MDTQQRPSPLRIIQNDYLSFMAVVLPLAVWIIFFFGATSKSTTLFSISCGITAAAIALLIWRVLFISRFFDTGEENTAIIQEIRFRRSRGTVNFSYIYRGARYSTDNLTTAIGQSKKMDPKQEVIILVDPDNPKRAIIKNLFTS